MCADPSHRFPFPYACKSRYYKPLAAVLLLSTLLWGTASAAETSFDWLALGIDARLESCLVDGRLPRPRLKAFVDSEIMAAMLADPHELLQLITAAADREALGVGSRCVTDGNLLEIWMYEATNLEKLGRATQSLMKVDTAVAWARAPLDPVTYELAGRAVFAWMSLCPFTQGFKR